MTFEGVALESACVDKWLVAAAEHKARVALRTGDGLRVQRGIRLVPTLSYAMMAHQRRLSRAVSRAMNLVGGASKQRLKPFR